MTGPASYEHIFGAFDSPLMQRVRAEAYDEDIGQHSWVTAERLRTDIDRLGVSERTRLLDIGCGPAGPLTYVVQRTSCRATGIDTSDPALAAGRSRAGRMHVERLVTLQRGNADEPLAFADHSFDVVISFDAVLHFADRERSFREIARVLVPGGKLLYTDAAIVTGAVSSEDLRVRSMHGNVRFVPPGYNERVLELSGFRVLASEDRTGDVLRNARGRLHARQAHEAELIAAEGEEEFARHGQYLETVIALAECGALSRFAYFAEASASRRTTPHQ